MYYYPTLQQLKEMPDLNRYGVVPVCCELYEDRKTPIEVLRILKHVSSHCYMLESAEDKKQWGRYTFLGYEPTLEITCHDHKLSIRSGMTITETVTHPGKYLRQILEQYKSPKLEGMPPFTGGLVGYFSYDYIKYSEPSLTLDAKEDEHFKDMDLMLFDKVICFDNYRQKIQLIVNCKTDNLETNYHQAQRQLSDMADLILHGEAAEEKLLHLKSEFRPLFSKDAYCEMVQKGKDYIKEGDIFQVVLSNRMEADMEGSLLDTYRVLRTSNPSPYMFYFSSEDVEIAGASPETLVKLENDKLYTFPLAGTRKRGETEAEDQRLEQELLADEKERAEHNMLVDLGRNDIGKISRIASVEVVKYMEIERFSHVMHIGSTVTGTIREAGTHTIDLSRKAEVLRGDKFAVVVKLRSSGKIGFDENDDYHWVSFVNKTKIGQSYLYDHRKWNDLNPDHATVRLKAYTVMQPVNKIHLRYCKADSKNKNPKGIVLYYKGKHLKKNKDYKIVKKEGHKYVIVKGRGRYRGTKKIYLKTK